MTRTVKIETSLPDSSWDHPWYHDNMHKIEAAIGRHITWGFGKYDTMSIWVDFKEKEIGAQYLKANGDIGYFIMAIWHEDEKEFSFHS